MVYSTLTKLRVLLSSSFRDRANLATVTTITATIATVTIVRITRGEMTIPTTAPTGGISAHTEDNAMVKYEQNISYSHILYSNVQLNLQNMQLSSLGVLY